MIIRNTIVFLMICFLLFTPSSVEARIFNPKKLTALKNILTSRFKKAANARELMEAELKAISLRKKLDWYDLEKMA